MDHLKTFESFKFTESHATFKIGALIEFHVPNTNKTRVGKVVTIDDTHITVIDLKTDDELRLPKKEFGPAYEN
jgi:hypothetical protein